MQPDVGLPMFAAIVIRSNTGAVEQSWRKDLGLKLSARRCVPFPIFRSASFRQFIHKIAAKRARATMGSGDRIDHLTSSSCMAGGKCAGLGLLGVLDGHNCEVCLQIT